MPAAEAQPAAPSAGGQPGAGHACSRAAPPRPGRRSVRSRARRSRRRAPRRSRAAEAAAAACRCPATPPPPANLARRSCRRRPAPVTAAAVQPRPAAPAVATGRDTRRPRHPPAADPTSTVSVTFANGSAALSATAADTLKQLAARRGAGIIAVTGYGDAPPAIRMPNRRRSPSACRAPRRWRRRWFRPACRAQPCRWMPKQPVAAALRVWYNSRHPQRSNPRDPA